MKIPGATGTAKNVDPEVDPGVDPYVQRWVARTNGNLYAPVVDRLKRYPIPKWPGPLPSRSGARMLDVGCGWGRWMVAAARAGYHPTGIDLKPLSVAAANRLLGNSGNAGRALVGDLRHLPFCDKAFDAVFSYSVLQHLPKSAALESLHEMGRVLKPGGYCLIELPLQPGMSNWRHPSCRSEDLDCWDVRYYGWQEALGLMGSLFDNVTAEADCIFGIGVKFEDLDILPWRYKPIVVASEGFRRLCGVFPGLVRFSDSIYLMGRKLTAPPGDH